MQKGYNEKITFKYSPCKAPDPCHDYEDYDPCQSEDANEKDLGVLLKEEQAKLQKEKENAEGELRKQQRQNVQNEERKGTGKSSDGKDGYGNVEGSRADGRGADGRGADGRGADGRGADGQGADGRGAREDRQCHRVRREVCKKLIQNPFFKNRLSFSSDLPPPPPVPPPQFFPLMDDESDSRPKICQPKRRKGRCMKKELVQRDRGEEGKKDEGKKEEGKKEEEEGECHCLDEEECTDANGGENAFLNVKGRRKCKKPDKWAHFPCRKKESEVSISLQPRKIPAIQRDLPPTSPKELPEVERQILMACEESRRECKKKKKICKKSEKVVEQ